MHPMREKLISIFRLNPRERRGLFIVCCILCIYWTGQYLLQLIFPASEDDLLRNQIKIESYKISKIEEVTADDRPEEQHEMFFFDPNTIGITDLQKLGLRQYLAERLVRFREAGGRFETRKDLQKIYGLSDEEYARLAPYVKIKREEVVGSGEVESTQATEVKFDINSATPDKWKKLHGIGPVLSTRIVKYRSQLGGFHSKEQLTEVYGISDSLYQTLLPALILSDSLNISRLKLNQLTIDSLRRHPYFRNFTLAQAIVRYRDQHGPYQSASDLSNLHLISDSLLKKIEPYLEFND